MTDKYAIIGNPISHSKSPQIHAAFAKQTNQDISYEAILAPLDGFKQTVERLISEGYKGANVTVPFKFEAFSLYDKLKPRAKSAGAVNTLTFSDGEVIGNNTDGVGLMRDIVRQEALTNRRILLLGAGGAAQGVLVPLLKTLPTSFVIANRSIDKAENLLNKVRNEDYVKPIATLQACAYQDLSNQQFDIIINATSTGLTDTALPIPSTIFAEGCLAYDMMYGRETPFMAQARAAGAQVSDGLGMLVEQAAEAFRFWRGVRPETAPVIEMLRENK